ncbi:hypothetical protein [Microcystis sp.]|uniref:hypothetical protein n=1 Tax=Microcystis sp. TaxID=1127 RepID=UPI00391A91E9
MEHISNIFHHDVARSVIALREQETGKKIGAPHYFEPCILKSYHRKENLSWSTKFGNMW